MSVGEAAPTITGVLGIAISASDWTNPVSTTLFFEAPLGVVGEQIGEPIDPSTVSLSTGYLAIFSPSNRRVVGFVYASVANGALTKLPLGDGPQPVAFENASTTLKVTMSMSPADWQTVFNERQSLLEQNELLLAPALVR